MQKLQLGTAVKISTGKLTNEILRIMHKITKIEDIHNLFQILRKIRIILQLREIQKAEEGRGRKRTLDTYR